MTIFTILIDALTLTICAWAASGCGQEMPAVSIPTPTVTQAPADSSSPFVEATPTPAPTVSVTYYSLTVTRQPNPNKFYTSTGYCLVYLGKTYCWDDHVHTIAYSAGVTGYYTYWGLSCNGTCQIDKAPQPTLINPVFTNQIMTGVTVSGVLSGTATTVTCTDNGSGVLDCGSFNVDTNQVGL